MTLKDLLEKHQYTRPHKNHKQAFEDAITEYITRNGATWYGALKEPVAEYLYELYESGEIKKTHKQRLERIERKIQRGDHKEWESRYLNMRQEKMKNQEDPLHMQTTAANMLRELRPDATQFAISNIYGAIREHHGLVDGDDIVIDPESKLFKRIGGEKAIIQSLVDKRTTNNIKSKRDQVSNNERARENVENLITERIFNAPNHQSEELTLTKLYRTEMARQAIAYKDPADAINFFQEETGIDLSAPQINKKYIF